SKRPLLSDGKEVLYKLKEERYDLYNRYCNYRIINDGTVDDGINSIIDIINDN
ncbi:shikimate kinase, partial [Clostridium saudiense]|nr:shikimate kinase [Clostridium saudiense]